MCVVCVYISVEHTWACMHGVCVCIMQLVLTIITNIKCKVIIPVLSAMMTSCSVLLAS